MSILIDNSITIYEALEHIKNGKYVMPAFQRQYVWNMEQVEKLWDSILLDYPIATFLFWHVDDDNVSWDTYFCNFLHEITFDSRKQADSVNYELSNINVKMTNTTVLDGQQRLTSLFLSLFGRAYIRQKHARKKNGGGTVVKLLIELNKHKLTVDEEEYNSKKFDIKFTKQDDALEMFVRFNGGGKVLKKHEITMSIIEAYWPSAKTEFGYLLASSYADFGFDFIVRSALMLYGDVVKSNINRQVVDDLKNHWQDFKKTLRNLENVLRDMKIEVSHFSRRWNVLLPVIYSIYNNPEYKNNMEGIRAYLVRAVLFIYFRSGTTGKLQQIKNRINECDYEITVDMLEQISDLRVTDGKIDDVINSEKGSSVADEALYFLNLDWINRNLKYEQDHLHPNVGFDNNRPIYVSMEDWRRWSRDRNRLPNLQLLEGRSNGSKNAMRLVDYYNDMNDEQKAKFCKEALIPDGVSLELENFEEFYVKRKGLLTAKIRQLLG